jgi:exonuclease SbcC
MIPLHLKLSGFLSYRDPAEVDFTAFDLACISGQNGAGKSSLLDAITWVLFGQARKRDESLINLGSDVAEVVLTFSYEGAVYRVLRTMPRGKTTSLEFQVLDRGPETKDRPLSLTLDQTAWRPLTERTLRETQARIEQVLRLDYETFINAAFFLQGRADQFAQQTASKRKEVLGNILGLEAWEGYKERTAQHRRALEREIEIIDGRVLEIETELSEEEGRKSRLHELEEGLHRLAATRQAQESALEGLKQAAVSLENQRAMVRTLANALERAQEQLNGLQSRLSTKQADRAAYSDLVDRAAQVESDYQSWVETRTELARLEETAARFHEHEARRQPLLREIESQRARLEQEYRTLEQEFAQVSEQSATIQALEVQLKTTRQTLAETEMQLADQHELKAQVVESREKLAELKAENQGLKAQMDELKARIEQLKATEGATCPLCGQELSESHRASTLAQLQKEGKSQGDRYRANQADMERLAEGLKENNLKIAALEPVEEEHLEAATTVTQLNERLENLQQRVRDWKKQGAKRLKELPRILEKGEYAAEARQALAQVDGELSTLGYDASAHDALRQAEVQARGAEAEFRQLEAARSALKPIEDEIANLASEIEKREEEIRMQLQEHDQAVAVLAAAEAQAPDVETAYNELLRLQEEENQLMQEVGAARQKVDVLDDLRVRNSDYAARREELGRQVGRHKTLERAFGKDGVPALLIEQALPQIESRANELLDRLSTGGMSIRFVTQAEYKDKKRDDLKETLDIQISDGAGIRDYEMYSGGEAFRINFAIRLALSEVLAQRKGARLQTLVIDEGFGSQDTQGRQRLIEAINLVKGDFAKILVITHLDELKDAFPNRIEVEKTERGSVVRVM